MYQGRPEVLRPAPDDVRPPRSDDVNLAAVERGISAACGTFLVLSGLRRRSLPMLIGGSALIYRGATGVCPVYRAIESQAGGPLSDGLQVEEAITVNKPPEFVYALWRRLENLPRFMSHIESVTVTVGNQSHWVAKLPAPLRLEWDAEIVDDQENKKLSWQSLPGSRIDHSGTVLFHFVPSRNSTEVKVILTFKPPAGSVGASIARLLNFLTKSQIRSDLRAFKAVAETGEKPTTIGQPSGRWPKRIGKRRRDPESAARQDLISHSSSSSSEATQWKAQ
jgi:uncharacterized membrane protein